MKHDVKIKPVGHYPAGAYREAQTPNKYFAMVSQTIEILDANGKSRTLVRTAIIADDLADIIKECKPNEAGIVQGKIVIIESLKPIISKNKQVGLKIAGHSGIPCTYKGRSIYMQFKLKSDVNAKDIRIQHDNRDEISKAFT